MFMPVGRAGRDGGAARCLRALRVWGSCYGTRTRRCFLDAVIEVLEAVRWDCKRAGVLLVSRSGPRLAVDTASFTPRRKSHDNASTCGMHYYGNSWGR